MRHDTSLHVGLMCMQLFASFSFCMCVDLLLSSFPDYCGWLLKLLHSKLQRSFLLHWLIMSSFFFAWFRFSSVFWYGRLFHFRFHFIVLNTRTSRKRQCSLRDVRQRSAFANQNKCRPRHLLGEKKDKFSDIIKLSSHWFQFQMVKY